MEQSTPLSKGDVENKSDAGTEASQTSTFAENLNSALVSLPFKAVTSGENNSNAPSGHAVAEMADVCKFLFASNELVLASEVLVKANKTLKSAQEAANNAEVRFRSVQSRISNMGIDVKSLHLTMPTNAILLRNQGIKKFSEVLFTFYKYLMEAALTFKEGDTVWIMDLLHEDSPDPSELVQLSTSMFDIINPFGHFKFSKGQIVSNQLCHAQKDTNNIQSCQHLAVVRQKDTQRRIPYCFAPCVTEYKSTDRPKFQFRIPYLLPACFSPMENEEQVVDLYFSIFGYFAESLQFCK